HQHGKGSVSTASAVLKKAAFVFTPQAQQPAATNPPELIAAAHAGSFSIALANELDRKSTRLNSSHSQISYAVFCLKKKKNHPSFVPLFPPPPYFTSILYPRPPILHHALISRSTTTTACVYIGGIACPLLSLCAPTA